MRTAGELVRISSGRDGVAYFMDNRTFSLKPHEYSAEYLPRYERYDLSRHDRKNGWVMLKQRGYHHNYRPNAFAQINLKRLRSILDDITLEELPHLQDFGVAHCTGLLTYRLPLKFGKNETNYYRRNYIEVQVKMEGQDAPDRVTLLFPCGERRRYKIANLEKFITRMGH